MPYLNGEEKALLAPITDAMFRHHKLVSTKGRINYLIHMLVMCRLFEVEKFSYSTVSEAIDAVVDAAAELRRRLLDPYEDGAIEKNGDVIHPLILKKLFGKKKK
jgi:hypothetical protein